MLVILIPVLFGLMGFAVDLGRLYMVRAELKTGADAMALAAAQQLIGTGELAEANARDAGAITFSNSFNRYDYGGAVPGESNGNLSSTVEYEFSSAAPGNNSTITTESQNRYASVTITADAPLTFFRFLSLGVEGRTPVQVRSVAGVSAPLCNVCATEPIIVTAQSLEDTNGEFGFVKDQIYSFGYVCTGPNQPQSVGAAPRVPFLLLDRFTTAPIDMTAAAMRAGAGGLPMSFGASLACVRAGVLSASDSSLFVSPVACAAPGNPGSPPPVVQAFVCGASTRAVGGDASGCSTDAITSNIPSFLPDSYIDPATDYASYTGNTRRIITVAVVAENINTNQTPTTVEILGFRQFLLDITFQPSNQTSVFNALYLGYPMPLKQGSFSTLDESGIASCNLTEGPGKVVLHQ